jgi:predicted nuclease of predicted toxin-antitoxin system
VTSACIVTRDSDFVRIAQSSSSARVVRLGIGNCSTPTLLARLDSFGTKPLSSWLQVRASSRSVKAKKKGGSLEPPFPH